MPNGRIRKAVDKSIRAAVSSGNLDLDKHAAPIGMLRFMADYLDTPGLETPPFRYASPASFLSYCEKLGLLPELEAQAAGAEPKAGSMKSMREKFRAFDGGKAANG